MKKTLSIILAILMIVTSVPMAFAAEGDTMQLYLKISDGYLSMAMTPDLYVKDDAGNEIKYDHEEYVGDDTYSYKIPADTELIYWDYHNGGGSADDDGGLPFFELPDGVDTYYYDYNVWYCSHNMNTSGEQTCKGQICAICDVNYGEADPNAHDWSNIDGICANGCGAECDHAEQTGEACEICGVTLHVCDFENAQWKYDDEIHWKQCACGEKEQESAHDYTEGEWSYDKFFHWKKCECDRTGLNDIHQYADSICISCGKECDHEYYDDGVCSSCGYECPHENVADEICENCGKDLHEHDFSGAWITNENKHWKECVCTQIAEEGKHAYIDGVCKCGYECEHKNLNGEICKDCGKDLHVHDFGDKWETDIYTHWKICSCYESLYGYHEYTDGVCDVCSYECLHTAIMNDVCLDCGKEIHYCDFTGEWQYDSEKHWKECTCGVTAEEAEHSFTDGKCECGYECPHEWNKGVLTRPAKIAANEWSDGYYTYTCDICGDSYNETVKRADYSDYNAFSEEISGLLQSDELTDAAKQEIRRARNIIGYIRSDLVESEQKTIDNLAAEIEELFADAEKKIASGEYVKADYTAIDEAIAEIEEKLADENVTDEAKAGLEEIKAQLEEMKADGNTSAVDVAEFEKALDEYETELDAGIADGSAVKIDANEMLNNYINETLFEFADKYGEDEVVDLINSLSDAFMDRVQAIGDEAKALTGSLKDNKEKLAELKEKVDEFLADIEKCLDGTHSFNYQITTPAACGKNAIESGECTVCGMADEREIPDSALTHTDADGDYKCDNGCGHEFEKPAPEEPTPDTPDEPDDETCADCGKVHTNFFSEIICLFTKIFNFIKKLFA